MPRSFFASPSVDIDSACLPFLRAENGWCSKNIKRFKVLKASKASKAQIKTHARLACAFDLT
jgi:hypothetical protein